MPSASHRRLVGPQGSVTVLERSLTAIWHRYRVVVSFSSQCEGQSIQVVDCLHLERDGRDICLHVLASQQRNRQWDGDHMHHIVAQI
jgi:hypothetical protein